MNVAVVTKSAEPATPKVDYLSALPVPVIVVDQAGEPVLANPAAELLLNIAEHVLCEKGWGAVLPPDSQLADIMHEARQSGADFAAYDVDLALLFGRRITVDVLVSPMADTPGWSVLAFQRRAAATIVNRQRGQQGAARSAVGVAEMLAHEIKNPLSGIRGAAQLLALDAGSELTNLILAEVDRIRELIDGMETFTDTRPARVEPVNIHVVLGHVRDLARHGFAANVHFQEDYDPSLPPVAGDRQALVQLFLNLVKNASEAMGGRGVIRLTTAFRHGLKIAVKGSDRRMSVPIEICVEDTGPGVKADLVDHIFDPFVTSKSAGGGLGLAMVAKIVSDHGGLVEYDRRGSPDRSVFRVLLPKFDT